MPHERRTPTDKPERFNVTSLTPRPEGPKMGRPPKAKMPPMPKLNMSDYEQTWYDYHYNAYIQEYPDLTDTDKITLMMASLEFVKYWRMIQAEMESGELVSMARQHPLVQYRALMDQLSVTRKARQAASKDKDPNQEEARQFLLGLSS